MLYGRLCNVVYALLLKMKFVVKRTIMEGLWMPRIAKLNDEFWVNFDDHCLYSNGCIIVELNKRPLDVLEYLCSYPNCYKKVDDINNYLEEGCLSATTIRGYIYSLRNYHPVLNDVITSTKSGYKYTGSKITDTYEGVDETLNCEKGIHLENVQKKRKDEEMGLLSSVIMFIDESNLTTESNITFFEDEKRLTRILQLAQKIKGKLSNTNDYSNALEKLITNRVDSYMACLEMCLCIRDCGEFLGQNILNENVLSNLHFLDCFARYAKKQGYEIDKSKYIDDPCVLIDLLVEVLKTLDGTIDFLDSIFYGPDRILLNMQKEKKSILETLYKYIAFER